MMLWRLLGHGPSVHLWCAWERLAVETGQRLLLLIF